VRIVELRITARRPSPQLINGSFWLDSRSHAVVRAGFRLARRFSSSDEEGTFMLPEVTAELDHVAIEYGLYDGRWWLPRSMVARGVVRLAGTRLPLAYERGYERTPVVGDTLAGEPTSSGVAAASGAEPGAPARRPLCRPRTSITINVSTGGGARADSAWGSEWSRATEALPAATAPPRGARSAAAPSW
jgi:hypothetical protein